MRRIHKTACAAAIAGILASCTSPRVRYEPPQAGWIVGEWNGTVALSEGGNPAREGPVSFSFSEQEYRVSGSKRLAPPGCGVYRFGSTLFLEDKCIHTAEFDWTLILNGGFAYTWDGETLTLEQADPGHGRHRYIVLHRVE